ncbi:protein S100-A4-like [Lissotriton helveticus]
MHLEELCGAMIQTFKKYSGADGKDGELNQEELSKLLKEEFPSLSASGKDEEMARGDEDDGLGWRPEGFLQRVCCIFSNSEYANGGM